jgi:hypothetical protein
MGGPVEKISGDYSKSCQGELPEISRRPQLEEKKQIPRRQVAIVPASSNQLKKEEKDQSRLHNADLMG